MRDHFKPYDHKRELLRRAGDKEDRNTRGQRGNKFNTSYRDISVVVAENNSVVKSKC